MQHSPDFVVEDSFWGDDGEMMQSFMNVVADAVARLRLGVEEDVEKMMEFLRMFSEKHTPNAQKIMKWVKKKRDRTEKKEGIFWK